MNVAFLGLGVMGYPMAGHWAAAGHAVTVFNRTAAKGQAWAAEYGGRAAATVAEAVAGARIVAMCVGADDDVRAVGGEALAAMDPGAILVDHTTASALVAREMDAKARALGLAFIDAPVSGGQAGAQNGVLTVMCGGEAETYERALSLMQVYARAVKLMGPVGSGQLTKMINQVCCATVLEGVAEGIHFAKRAGLDPEAVLETISKGAAQSWYLENRWSTAARGEFDFGFAVDWMRKDLGLVLDEARRNGAAMPVTALLEQFYGEVQAMGGGRWDCSSLTARLEDRRRT